MAAGLKQAGKAGLSAHLTTDFGRKKTWNWWIDDPQRIVALIRGLRRKLAP